MGSPGFSQQVSMFLEYSPHPFLLSHCFTCRYMKTEAGGSSLHYLLWLYLQFFHQALVSTFEFHLLQPLQETHLSEIFAGKKQNKTKTYTEVSRLSYLKIPQTLLKDSQCMYVWKLSWKELRGKKRKELRDMFDTSHRWHFKCSHETESAKYNGNPV